MGREGGDADITVRDKSVSKHHARLYAMDGEWWLEDLNSANGTYVDDQRINGPVPLGPGTAFTLSNYQFEVVRISATDAGASDDDARLSDRAAPKTRVGGMPTDDEGFAEPTAPPTGGKRGGNGAAAKQSKGKSAPPPPPPKKGGRAAMEVDDDFAAPSDVDEGESLEGGFGVAMAQLPRAIAYYMATVPKLLFNPIGTVRNSIEEQNLPGMKGFPLLGWALPGLAISIGMGTICGIIASLIGLIHTGFGGVVSVFVGAIMGIVIAAVSGIIGGLIVAFVYHPIFKFFVEKLFKGKTTEKSRTNYLPISMAAGILVSLPAGLGAILLAIGSFIPVPAVVALLPIVPLLVGLAGNILTLYTAREWMKFFETAKWVPLVLLILMILAGAGTAFGMVGQVRVAINTITNGGGGTMVAGGGTTGTPGVGTRPGKGGKFDASRLTPEQRQAYDSLSGEAKSRFEEQMVNVWAMQAEAGMTGTPAGGKPTPAASATATAKPMESKTEPHATPTETKVALVNTPHDAATPDVRPTPAIDDNPPTNGSPNTPYRRWAARRDQVEKAIADDPTILGKDPQTFNLYKQLHAIEADARRKYAGKAPDDVVTQRMVDAETFDKAQKLVDDLHARLFHN